MLHQHPSQSAPVAAARLCLWLAGATLVAGTLIPAASRADVQCQVYDSGTEFQQGALDGVVVNGNGDLELSVVGTTFPVLWIANAGEDTVSKIDTDANCEIARYKTTYGSAIHDAWTGTAPSRTAVDGDGNVYVANRQFDGKRMSVMKILTEGGIDRNGNGSIDTSADTDGDCQIESGEYTVLADTSGSGELEGNELADERVAWITYLGPANSIGRALCIDGQGAIWVGDFNNEAYYKLNATTGAILAGPISVSPINPYGCAVDRNGVLWSADRGDGGTYGEGRKLGRIDTATAVSLGHYDYNLGEHYSINVGNNKVYLAIETNSWYLEIDPLTGAATTRASTSSRGISVDGSGNIVLGRDTVEKRDSTGTLIWQRSNPAGWQDQRGVVVDRNNDVWVVNLNANSLTKFRGTDGVHLATVPVGRSPYTYSDATGFAYRNVADPTGIWTAIMDSGTSGVGWNKVRWNQQGGSVPSGASITVDVRAADNQVQLPFQTYQTVTNGTGGIGVQGRYLQVRVTLRPNGANESPILSDLTAQPTVVTCDTNQDCAIDLTDIRSILAARNSPGGASSPADRDGNGVIDMNDVRQCTLRCDKPRCAN